jgi:hypothetical protein
MLPTWHPFELFCVDFEAHPASGLDQSILMCGFACTTVVVMQNGSFNSFVFEVSLVPFSYQLLFLLMFSSNHFWHVFEGLLVFQDLILLLR